MTFSYSSSVIFVMETMNDSVRRAEETAEDMRRKYRETTKSVADIEAVVGNLMEQLGEGGLMGIKDIHPGMRVLIEKAGDKAVYSGSVLEAAGDTLVVSSPTANGRALDAKNASGLHLQIVVSNVLYNWDKLTLSAHKDGSVTITVSGDPTIVNRRRFPRMPLSNPCTILNAKNETVCAGHLENISAGGFAFTIPVSSMLPAAGNSIRLKVENFDHIVPSSTLEGTVIRASVRDGNCTVGCRMAEDNTAIHRYVKENYSDN